MEKLIFDIVYTARKNICIKIERCKLCVYAPRKMKRADILRFLAEKEQWIQRTLCKQREDRDRFYEILAYHSFLLFGEVLSVQVCSGQKQIFSSGSILVIPDFLTQPASPTAYRVDQKVLHHIQLWYRRQAYRYLSERIGELAKDMKLDFSKIRISSAKNRWGSCNAAHVLALNWRLILLPKQLIDYVLIHELCHIRQLNHSEAFWRMVTDYCPDYKSRRKELKNYAVLMDLFR